MIFFIGWGIFREFFRPKWYTDESDLFVITLCWSVVPFWVENSVKVSQGAQLEKQSQQIKMLEEQQVLLLQQAKLNMEVINKIFGTVEKIEDIVEEVSRDEQSS